MKDTYKSAIKMALEKRLSDKAFSRGFDEVQQFQKKLLKKQKEKKASSMMR